MPAFSVERSFSSPASSISLGRDSSIDIKMGWAWCLFRNSQPATGLLAGGFAA
jgi:hypothetical protein